MRVKRQYNNKLFQMCRDYAIAHMMSEARSEAERDRIPFTPYPLDPWILKRKRESLTSS